MSAEPRLLLVRHSVPVQDRNAPAATWVLATEGRRRAESLARALAARERADRIITSREPKARETGEIMGRVLGVGVTSHAGLHEHERTSVPFFSSSDEFRQRVVEAIARPKECVFGDESANEAHERFEAAVAAIAEQDERVMIVSHGLVIALFVAYANGLDPVGLWLSLRMPCALVLRLPGYELLDVRYADGSSGMSSTMSPGGPR